MGVVDVGSSSPQATPAKPALQWHLLVFVQNCERNVLDRGKNYRKQKSITYAISRALDVLHICRTFRCVDVGKDADASLIDTNEIFAAWRSIEYESLLGKEFLRALRRPTCGSVWSWVLIKNWLRTSGFDAIVTCTRTPCHSRRTLFEH